MFVLNLLPIGAFRKVSSLILPMTNGEEPFQRMYNVLGVDVYTAPARRTVIHLSMQHQLEFLTTKEAVLTDSKGDLLENYDFDVPDVVYAVLELKQGATLSMEEFEMALEEIGSNVTLSDAKQHLNLVRGLKVNVSQNLGSRNIQSDQDARTNKTDAENNTDSTTNVPSGSNNCEVGHQRALSDQRHGSQLTPKNETRQLCVVCLLYKQYEKLAQYFGPNAAPPGMFYGGPTQAPPFPPVGGVVIPPAQYAPGVSYPAQVPPQYAPTTGYPAQAPPQYAPPYTLY